MLKKFISESFFNPVLHILPIIIFIVVDDIWGVEIAWLVSAIPALAISAYVFIFYKSIFRWNVISSTVFLAVASIVTLSGNIDWLESIKPIIGELSALIFFLVLIVFKKPIKRIVRTLSNGARVSMKNNLNELVRINIIFSVILSIFIMGYVWTMFNNADDYQNFKNFLYQFYAWMMILAVLYEMIRVFAIRGQLLKEDWLPIVNANGKEIGSVNYQISIWNEENKYTHPVVRLIVIDENKLFLQQHNSKSEFYSTRWDNALSGHLKLGEKIPDCINRIAGEVYETEIHNPVFLGNYQLENHCEIQYVHLFLSCKIHEPKPNPAFVDRVKWWTLPQIQEEINSGIFTDNFIKEYQMLERSGLIGSGSCACECKLREELMGN